MTERNAEQRKFKRPIDVRTDDLRAHDTEGVLEIGGIKMGNHDMQNKIHPPGQEGYIWEHVSNVTPGGGHVRVFYPAPPKPAETTCAQTVSTRTRERIKQITRTLGKLRPTTLFRKPH